MQPWLLAQILPPGDDVPFARPTSWLLVGAEVLFSAIALLYTLFWLWMLIDCILRESDRFFWIWLIVIVPFPGPIVYAVVRFLPQRDVRLPRALRGLWRRSELLRLQAAAEQIGNCHQWNQYGEALREVGRLPEADAAFRQALSRDPQSLPALWGATQVAMALNDKSRVRSCCEAILERDPQYKFGDVSLIYGKALLESGETEQARAVLQKHVQRWRHPEALYLLACLYRDAGETDAAREQLQAMIRDIQGSPPAIARRFGQWMSKGRRLLRQLPAASTTPAP